MLRLSQQNEGFRLIDTRDFTFYRETTLSEVRELTENRFYSCPYRMSVIKINGRFEAFS